jgi:hypothetical protein
MPRITEVPVPDGSKVRQAVGTVHFCDAYQAPLSRAGVSVEQAYRAVFGHRSGWADALMTIRGWLVAPFGLMHPTKEIYQAAEESFRRSGYQVGQRVGIFTIQSIEPNELIAGEDDRHLDFRVSVFKAAQRGAETVTVSTVVQINNTLGRLYLQLIKPFHRVIVRSMVQRAVDAGRL